MDWDLYKRQDRTIMAKRTLAYECVRADAWMYVRSVAALGCVCACSDLLTSTWPSSALVVMDQQNCHNTYMCSPVATGRLSSAHPTWQRVSAVSAARHWHVWSGRKQQACVYSSAVPLLHAFSRKNTPFCIAFRTIHHDTSTIHREHTQGAR